MEQDLKELLAGMESRLNASFEQRLEAMELRLRERIDKVEASLLEDFSKWARINDVKLRQHAHVIAAFDERIALLEERLAAIERLGHFPLNPKAN